MGLRENVGCFILGDDEQLKGHLNRAARFLYLNNIFLIPHVINEPKFGLQQLLSESCVFRSVSDRNLRKLPTQKL